MKAHALNVSDSTYKNRSFIAIDCGALGNPANGVVSKSNTTYNSTATYSCNTGYTLTGDKIRTCLESGFWSGSAPTCTGKYCAYTCMLKLPIHSSILLY